MPAFAVQTHDDPCQNLLSTVCTHAQVAISAFRRFYAQARRHPSFGKRNISAGSLGAQPSSKSQVNGLKGLRACLWFQHAYTHTHCSVHRWAAGALALLFGERVCASILV